jgi:CRISPR-associated endonuclease/helicase Cas3
MTASSKHNRLLAKSYDVARYPGDPPDYALLTQHSQDVADVCDALVSVVGRRALSSLGLSSSLVERLRRALTLNGWLQDIGKISSQFQAMVSGESEIMQLLRHEQLSALLIWTRPELRQWLAAERDLVVALWGAVGHHRKFDEETTVPESGAMIAHLSHPDFALVLQGLAKMLGLKEPPLFLRDLVVKRTPRDGGDLIARDALCDMRRDFEDLEQQQYASDDDASDDERRLLALVKGLGIGADMAASAIARRAESAARYSVRALVEETLTQCLTVGDLDGLIREWAWARASDDATGDHASEMPSGFTTLPFQTAVATSKSAATLARAGCGSGKSLAAYLWARSWAEQRGADSDDAFRLFFCLPTTGTATEHFRDYALESGVPARLAHSRSSIDLDTIATTAVQEEAFGEQQRAAVQAAKAERDKLEAIALWSTPLVVCTVDTVLGLLANARRSICALPAILQAGIVFDEIHAFDDRLFGHLLVFLSNFPGLPVLLMTASLPQARLDDLRSARPDLAIINGPPDREELERYELRAGTTDEVWPLVAETLSRPNHNKVLWVRNTVDRANCVYAHAREQFKDVRVDVYHSRFRYEDRSKRHRRVIDRFGDSNHGALLVATQVAEMSLDLSADLLVTDEAPVSALIQRMGRLNRRSTPEKPVPPKPAIVCNLPKGEYAHLPYEQGDLADSRRWVKSLLELGRPLSQKDLSDEFGRQSHGRAVNRREADEAAEFFGVAGKTGLWRTVPGMTRADGTTLSVLLERDLKAHADAHGGREPNADWVRRHEVSIPFKPAMLAWKRVRGIRVAPSPELLYEFDEQTAEGTGARWAR